MIQLEVPKIREFLCEKMREEIFDTSGKLHQEWVLKYVSPFGNNVKLQCVATQLLLLRDENLTSISGLAEECEKLIHSELSTKKSKHHNSVAEIIQFGFSVNMYREELYRGIDKKNNNFTPLKIKKIKLVFELFTGIVMLISPPLSGGIGQIGERLKPLKYPFRYNHDDELSYIWATLSIANKSAIDSALSKVAKYEKNSENAKKRWDTRDEAIKSHFHLEIEKLLLMGIYHANIVKYILEGKNTKLIDSKHSISKKQLLRYIVLNFKQKYPHLFVGYRAANQDKILEEYGYKKKNR